MDEDLQRIIRHVLEDARARGKGYASEPMLTLLAVRAVREARPDMTASEALVAINVVKRK